MRSTSRRNFLKIIGILGLEGFTGCLSQPKEEKMVLSSKDNGKTIQISKGKIIIIRLSENPSTGYEWQYKEDQEPAKIIKSRYLSLEDPKIGEGGIRELKLEIKGDGDFTMQYIRPWENQSIKNYSVTFKVK